MCCFAGDVFLFAVASSKFPSRNFIPQEQPDVKRGEISGRSAESDLFGVLDQDILGSRYFLHVDSLFNIRDDGIRCL